MPSSDFLVTCDANGNLTGDGTRTYEWDAENRLLAVKQGGSPLATFAYDRNRRRATKTAGGVTTSYVYDGARFLEERPSSGPSVRYAYGQGIDRPLVQSVAGVATYFVADHLGSVVRLADATGTPSLAREYDPWGRLLQGSATSGYAFTGREWDPETSLYYYRARHYDSGIGRFIGEDPSFHPNLYVYASGNPLLWIDPWGLDVFLRSEGRFHSSVIIPDPASSTGFSEYSYQPMYGGWEQPLMTIGSPAQMLNLKSSPSSTSGTLPICADAAGDKAALEEAERIRHSPGTYNPITNNCAGVARKVIL